MQLNQSFLFSYSNLRSYMKHSFLRMILTLEGHSFMFIFLKKRSAKNIELQRCTRCMTVLVMSYWNYRKTNIGDLIMKWDKDVYYPFTIGPNNAPLCTSSYLCEAEFSGKAVVKNKYSNLLSTENEILLCLKLPTAPKQICDSKQTHLSH